MHDNILCDSYTKKIITKDTVISREVRSYRKGWTACSHGMLWEVTLILPMFASIWNISKFLCGLP